MTQNQAPAPPSPGFTLWLLGGGPQDQTAVATRLAEAFAEAGLSPELVEGPALGGELWPELEPGGDEAARRLGRVAWLLARHGAAVVVAGAPASRDALDALRLDLGELVVMVLGEGEGRSVADLTLDPGDPIVAVGQALAWLMDMGYLTSASQGGRAGQEGYTPEEEAEVMRRLAELGYV